MQWALYNYISRFLAISTERQHDQLITCKAVVSLCPNSMLASICCFILPTLNRDNKAAKKSVKQVEQSDAQKKLMDAELYEKQRNPASSHNVMPHAWSIGESSFLDKFIILIIHAHLSFLCLLTPLSLIQEIKTMMNETCKTDAIRTR